MSAMSLNEEELSKRISEVEAVQAKLLERSSSGGTSALSTRIKTVEGDLVDLKARLDAIEADPQGLKAKTAGSTSTKR